MTLESKQLGDQKSVGFSWNAMITGLNTQYYNPVSPISQSQSILELLPFDHPAL